MAPRLRLAGPPLLLALTLPSCRSPSATALAPTPAPIAATVLSAADLATLDNEVLRVALLDLLAHEAKGSFFNDGRRDVVYFTPIPDARLGTIDSALEQAAHDKWPDLSFTQRAAAREAAAHVRARTATSARANAPSARFAPSDPRIVLLERDPAAPFDLATPRPFSAVPPGYSADRRTAVVGISFPWSMHSGDAVFVLRRDDTGWKVISRHMSFYV